MMDNTAPDINTTIGSLVAEWRAKPFAWGATDCCQFARAAAWSLHRIVVDAPPYISEREAVRVLRRLGGYQGLMRAHGLQPREIINARRGDFVIFDHEGPGLFEQGIALVTGTHAHAPTASGLVSLERAAWAECWGVA